MPAETDRHERLWMAFPLEGATLGTDAASAHRARLAWAAVANAAVEFEPVTVVVDPSAVEVAREYLSPAVNISVAPLDDYWMRDIGPTFVRSEDGSVAAIDWIFNGWGDQQPYALDAEIGAYVSAVADVPRLTSVLVNEGGGIHVDGEGTVILTETVQLDPHRNPFATKERVEAELARTIGATTFIWLPRGLTRDYEPMGTRGHVDMVATITAPGSLLLHVQNNPEHPDYEVTRALRAFLSGTRDAAGREWEITEIPGPDILRDDEGFVDYNYVNHLVLNGGVIACAFGDEVSDARARDILAAAYPGRRVVSIDARPIFERGGGIHCITQQQPAALAE
jgi:agmatine deiminase